MEYVVDASVILKWVLGDEKEPDQIKAMQLLNAWAAGDAAISAPTLWQYEVGNFLGREVPEEAKEKMGLLLDLKIRNVELSDNMYQLCFAWMREYRVSFYDASYLAVAYGIQATLVTADERFVRKLGKVDHLCVLREINP
ncbi:MAG: type II toxin-antitoxin system VapC family toxin [Lentisphaerae bacterium]|nr:type II toxin-antitoxin system VapC family toxin [Lentisphaerota bacterium]